MNWVKCIRERATLGRKAASTKVMAPDGQRRLQMQNNRTLTGHLSTKQHAIGKNGQNAGTADGEAHTKYELRL